LLLENIRSESKFERNAARALVSIKVGVITEPIEVGAIHSHHQLWIRMRADLSSIAFICIHMRDFFDFATCEDAMEAIHEFLYTTFDGSMAKIGFYIHSYMSTWKKWQGDVNRQGMTLRKTVADRNGWANYWTNMVRLGDLPGSSKDRLAADPATAHPDNPNQTNALNRLHGMMDKSFHHPKEHGPHQYQHQQKRKAHLSPNQGQAYGTKKKNRGAKKTSMITGKKRY